MADDRLPRNPSRSVIDHRSSVIPRPMSGTTRNTGRPSFDISNNWCVSRALLDHPQSLQLDHLVVAAGAGHQLGMSAGLDDRAGLQDEDPLGALHGAETVGDHERRAIAQ